MPDYSRYSRMGGYRRGEGLPYMTQFGYGGAGYGGFGRYGKYGGWRSHYPYGQQMNYNWAIPQGPPVNMKSTRANFVFALILIGLLVIGVYFGLKNKKNILGRGYGGSGYNSAQNIIFRPF